MDEEWNAHISALVFVVSAAGSGERININGALSNQGGMKNDNEREQTHLRKNGRGNGHRSVAMQGEEATIKVLLESRK